MSFYTLTPPQWLKLLYGRGFLWNIKTAGQEVYLTFDDGPVPNVTPWVLDLLKQYHAKATFFCIGSNVVANPELYQRIITEGHAVGNHTYNHLNGLKTPSAAYFKNIADCAAVINSKLFRPPYGKLKLNQARRVNKEYTGVMWSVLSADWDSDVTPEQCLANAIQHTKAGTIIVFHDSVKAERNLRYALPLYLEWLKDKGYEAKVLG